MSDYDVISDTIGVLITVWLSPALSQISASGFTRVPDYSSSNLLDTGNSIDEDNN